VKRNQQRALWSNPQTRTQMDDQRKPQVGDRVWCAGRPCVITHINADGSTGLAYVRLPATAPGGKPRSR
jgi:hypothetical protein